MKTALFNLPDSNMTFMQAVDYARELGVDAIEPYTHAELAQPSVDAARRIADYAAERGIGICCFSMGADLTGADSAAEVERLKRYADVAAALGSPYLHHLTAPSLSVADRLPVWGVLLRRIAPAVRDVFDYAAEKGVACVYEEQGMQVNGISRFEDFLDAVDRPVGVVADVGNSLFVGTRPEAFVGRFAARTVHVHLKDYIIKGAQATDPGEGWYHAADGSFLRDTIVGHGDVNFVSIFRMLREAGYDGYYALEFSGMEPAREAHRMGIANARRFHAMAGM